MSGAVRHQSTLAKQAIGSRLQHARESRGFENLTHLSSVSKISEEIILAVEAGEFEPFLEEMYVLLCLYGEPMHSAFQGFFTSEKDLDTTAVDIASCRSQVSEAIAFHKRLRGKDENLKSLPFGRGKYGAIEVDQLLDRANRNLSQRLVPETLKRRAKEVIHKHNVYKLPINIYQIAHNLGVEVVFESFPNELYMQLKGFCYKDDDFSLIGINRSHPVALQRFTMAHELHHYIYDFEEARFLCGPENQNRAIEWNAESFAAELLMPHEYVKKLISSPANVRYLTVNLVAEHFGVSYEAAAIRLSKYGLLSDSKLACTRPQRRKDLSKTKYLLEKHQNKLIAVFGLETGIELLQLEHEPERHELCGAPITNPQDHICWKCGLELNMSSIGNLNNLFRQNPAITASNKVASIQNKSQDYNQLSFNLST